MDWWQVPGHPALPTFTNGDVIAETYQVPSRSELLMRKGTTLGQAGLARITNAVKGAINTSTSILKLPLRAIKGTLMMGIDAIKALPMPLQVLVTLGICTAAFAVILYFAPDFIRQVIAKVYSAAAPWQRLTAAVTGGETVEDVEGRVISNTGDSPKEYLNLVRTTSLAQANTEGFSHLAQQMRDLASNPETNGSKNY